MAKGYRRRLRGKKLLIVSGTIAGVSMLGCGDDATANLIAPPDTGIEDTGTPDGATDGATDGAIEDTGVVIDSAIDAPVANLIAPPDTGPVPDAASDSGPDGSSDAS